MVISHSYQQKSWNDCPRQYQKRLSAAKATPDCLRVGGHLRRPCYPRNARHYIISALPPVGVFDAPQLPRINVEGPPASRCDNGRTL